MSKKDKHRFLPWLVVIACGFGVAILIRLLLIESGRDTGTANLTFILVFAGFVLAYLLFRVVWEPLFLKIFGKRLSPKLRYRPDLPENAELQKKIESFCRYSDEVLSGYVDKDDLELLHIYISQYAQSNMGDISQKVKTTGVDQFDLYHYGWNIWNYFDRIVGQPETADWLINMFDKLDGNKRSIYKKFKHDERATYKIPLEPNIK